MARYFTASSSEYLERNTSPPVPPLTVSMWFWPVDATTAMIPFMICDKDSAVLVSAAIELSGLGAGQCAAYDRAGGAPRRAVCSNSYTAQTWNHVVGTWGSGNKIRCYLNGDLANNGGLTVTLASLTEDRISIGRAGDSTPGAYMDGALAEVAIWGEEFAEDDPDILPLAAGCSPLVVRPKALLAYWPLLAGDTDLIGGYDMTAYNTPTWHTSHAPIWTPRGGTVVAPATAGSAPVPAPYYYLMLGAA